MQGEEGEARGEGAHLGGVVAGVLRGVLEGDPLEVKEVSVRKIIEEGGKRR